MPPPPASVLRRRLARLSAVLQREKLDAMVIHDRASALYFSGLPSSNSLAIVSPARSWFLTDFRYIEKAEAAVRHMTVIQAPQSFWSDVKPILAGALRAKRIGFEGSLPYAAYRALASAVGTRRLVEAGALPVSVRMIKEPTEIRAIADNQKLNESLYARAVKRARPGQSELRIQQDIRADMVGRGVEEAFETIVATGPNTSMPHATPSNRQLGDGDFLLLDMGVRSDSYHSDMTRVVVAGRPTPRHRQLYALVLEAQERALATIRPGVECSAVDSAARDFLAAAGYGHNFRHGLGHGVGLEIHEEPRLNPSSRLLLEPGMVVTVEPGVYIPGFGGVRIEDLVVVTRTGFRNLTGASKRLRSI